MKNNSHVSKNVLKRRITRFVEMQIESWRAAEKANSAGIDIPLAFAEPLLRFKSAPTLPPFVESLAGPTRIKHGYMVTLVSLRPIILRPGSTYTNCYVTACWVVSKGGGKIVRVSSWHLSERHLLEISESKQLDGDRQRKR